MDVEGRGFQRYVHGNKTKIIYISVLESGSFCLSAVVESTEYWRKEGKASQ